MLNRIISALFLTYIAITCVVFFVVAVAIWLATVWWDRRLVWLHLFSSFWASLYVWTMPAWSVTVKGRDKLNWDTTYVIVSNHQSQLDILVAFGLFFPFKWVSKAEIFRVPLVGWNMVLNRYIRLKRGDRASIQQMHEHSEEALRQGSSVFFFPEGTRSPNGQLKDFRSGAFHLAHKLQKPIVPIAINGTKDALPKYSLNFHGHHDIELQVLDPIPYEAFASMTVAETASWVRQRIAEHVRAHDPRAEQNEAPQQPTAAARSQ